MIGAGRSGTTSLCAYLKDHSEVCFSFIKEVPYFSLEDHYARGEDHFHSFFRKCNNAPVIATSDTYLLMDREAPSRIRAYNPDMKIVVMLRDPVARAYSSYTYSVNFGHHEAYASFLDSMEAEKDIASEPDIVRRNNLGHFYGSLYHRHLSHWLKYFPREQILLLRTGDLDKQPEAFGRALHSFLGLQRQEGEIGRINVASGARNRKLERVFMDREHGLRKGMRRLMPRGLKNLIMRTGLIDRLHAANRKAQHSEPLSTQEYEQAWAYFREDLLRLKEDFGFEI